MKVFIADDAPSIRSRLIKLLSEQSEVQVVGQSGDATEALETIRRLKPDAVILAIHMYGGSGIDLLKTIRKEQPAMLIIMLTNSAYTQYRNKCLQVGADFFFDKSNEFDQVVSIFKRTTRNSDKRPMAYSAYVHGASGGRA